MTDARVCVITGATSGIGRAAALALAGQGFMLAALGRDPEKGAELLRLLHEFGDGRPHQFFRADFTTLDDVRRVAGELAGRYRAIEVLVNNAGVIMSRRVETVDDHETTFQVNHLAPFLLTGLLLDNLRAAPSARIVNVASMAHRYGRLDIEDLDKTRRFSAFGAYGPSKLANILFTAELARRLAGTNVAANSLHPGAVASEFGKNNGALGRLAMALLRPFFLTPEKAADTVVYLASSPEVEGASGGYYHRRRIAPVSAAARDEDLARRLWAKSEKMVGLSWSSNQSG